MCVPYWWCTKHAQLIMGTWPIYKKTLPTTDLNNNIKKQLSFDKISPRDFFSFLFNLCLLIIGFDHFDDFLELFHILWKLFSLPSTWTCGHAFLKTVLKLMIYWNIIDLLMLRIITVAVLVILVEFRLNVVFCCNILWYTVATFSWFLRRVAAIGNIFRQRN